MAKYPWALLPKLVKRVENAQREEAHEKLDQLFDVFKKNKKERLPQRKLRCAQVMSACQRGSINGGAPSEDVFRVGNRSLEGLSRANQWKEVEKLMHRFIDRLVDLVVPTQRTDIEKAVTWIREDLKKTLDTPKTLEQYANTLGISAGHLSREFSEIAGCSFREELNHQRVQTGMRLLEGTSMKIWVVARRVGLMNPSQFIALFRREVGKTPAEYRKYKTSARKT